MQFRYLRDPLFLLSVTLYVINRIWWKPCFGGFFLTGYFNDLLLIPAALPPILWFHQQFGWRKNHGFPTAAEILGHLALWALIAEIIGPHLKSTSVADWNDLAAYTAGALLSLLIWHRRAPIARP